MKGDEQMSEGGVVVQGELSSGWSTVSRGLKWCAPWCVVVERRLRLIVRRDNAEISGRQFSTRRTANKRDRHPSTGSVGRSSDCVYIDYLYSPVVSACLWSFHAQQSRYAVLPASCCCCCSCCHSAVWLQDARAVDRIISVGQQMVSTSSRSLFIDSTDYQTGRSCTPLIRSSFYSSRQV